MMATLEEELEAARAAAEDDDDTATDKIPKWSTSSPTDHALIVEELKNRGIPAAVAGDLANDLADQYLRQKGTLPSVFDLLSDPTAINRMSYTQSGLYALPSAFGVRQADGTVRYYKNDPLQGIAVVTASSDDFGFGLKEMASSGTPVFAHDDVAAILASAGFGTKPGGGGGGGGGGVAPKPPVWDRDQLIESASNMWRGMLLDEPADVGRIVDDYTARAASFFMEQGGRMDFETFVLGRIRETPRYRILYQNMQPGISEEAHLGQYVQAVRQLGFRDQRVNELVTQGASSGASVAGFTERLERRPEYVQANQGKFSQQFGNMISQLGIRGT
jgi:hypothetical protein